MVIVNAENIIKSVLKGEEEMRKIQVLWSFEATLREDLFSAFMNNPGLEVEV